MFQHPDSDDLIKDIQNIGKDLYFWQRHPNTSRHLMFCTVMIFTLLFSYITIAEITDRPIRKLLASVDDSESLVPWCGTTNTTICVNRCNTLLDAFKTGMNHFTNAFPWMVLGYAVLLSGVIMGFHFCNEGRKKHRRQHYQPIADTTSDLGGYRPLSAPISRSKSTTERLVEIKHKVRLFIHDHHNIMNLFHLAALSVSVMSLAKIGSGMAKGISDHDFATKIGDNACLEKNAPCYANCYATLETAYYIFDNNAVIAMFLSIAITLALIVTQCAVTGVFSGIGTLFKKCCNTEDTSSKKITWTTSEETQSPAWRRLLCCKR